MAYKDPKSEAAKEVKEIYLATDKVKEIKSVYAKIYNKDHPKSEEEKKRLRAYHRRRYAAITK